MQHILALSVIILHHVDSYSCRTVAKQLQLPSDTDSNVTESFEVKEREQEITSILKQFLERSSSEMSSSEQLQKRLAKLTIEPYQGKNTTKTKDPLHWFDKHKKTIAPLAIIVTNLQELTKLQNRDRHNEKKHLMEYTEDKSITSDINPQDERESPKQTFKEITDTDLNTHLNINKKGYHSDPEVDNEVSFEKNDNLDVTSNDLEDFSVEDDVFSSSTDINKDDNSPFIDVGWHSKEILVSDKIGDENISNEKKKLLESLERPNDISVDDFELYITEPSNKVEVEENKNNQFKEHLPNETGDIGVHQQVEGKLHAEDQENLVNLLVEDIDGTDLRIIEGNEHAAPKEDDGTPPVIEDSKITLKVTNDVEEEVVSSKEHHRVAGGANHHGKRKKKRRHNSRNTYNLSFLFNK